MVLFPVKNTCTLDAAISAMRGQESCFLRQFDRKRRELLASIQLNSYIEVIIYNCLNIAIKSPLIVVSCIQLYTKIGDSACVSDDFQVTIPVDLH